MSKFETFLSPKRVWEHFDLCFLCPLGMGVITDCIQVQLQHTPGPPVFILCDFNHCKLETAFSGYEQHVKCNTRDKKVLDKYYGNIHVQIKASLIEF